MEKLNFDFGPWTINKESSNKRPVIVGVVGSGNLEILLESKNLNGKTEIVVETSVSGFEKTWSAVLKDFVEQYQFSNTLISINDGGATPAVVQLRLSQAARQWGDL